MSTHHFVLNDSDGNPHNYTVTPVAPSQAMPFAVALSEAVAGPVLESLFADSPDVIGKFGREVSGVLRLAAQPEHRAILFGGVFRDGKPLNNSTNFDGAYVRNYGEMRAAMLEVVRFNGFFGLLGISSVVETMMGAADSLGDVWGRLESALRSTLRESAGSTGGSGAASAPSTSPTDSPTSSTGGASRT